MAQTTTSIQTPDQNIPFYRDGRILGVIGQIIFIIVLVLVIRVLAGNFSQNVEKLGDSQFICRNGDFSYRCAYDFMESEAGFDINETIFDYENTDSYWYAFYLGFLNTLKVGLLGVVFATILGTLVGIARLSDNWLISRVALWYVELMRNIPLLILLFLLYFVAILGFLPNVKEAIQPLGLPIFITNRGLDIPWPKFTSSAGIWVAFLILAIIQFQVLWVIMGRQEEKTGKPSNRMAWGIFSFLLIAMIGWSVAGSLSKTQGILVSKASRIRELDDLEKIVLTRAGVNHISELGELSDDETKEIEVKLCVVSDSSSEINLTSQIRKMSLPYSVKRFSRAEKATDAYAEGKCEMFVATNAILAGERSALESPSSHAIVPVTEKPIVLNAPAFEGFNIEGGTSLSPEFTALLVGLFLFYAASIAELVRAGIQSVSKGQSEAAYALGLNESQRLRLVVLPQSLKVIIPPLIGTYLSLIKDTSLGLAVGYPDMYRIGFVTVNQSGRSLQVFLLLMVAYLTISVVFSMLLNWYNAKNTLVER